MTAREGIGCLAFLVFLPIAPCAVAGAPRAAAALFLVGVAFTLITLWLCDRARRRPSRELAARMLSTYRQDDSDAIELVAREHLEKEWLVAELWVMARRRFRTWWGSERVELDVDLGWERAYVTIELAARSGWLVRTAVSVKRGFEDTTIDADEALAIARDEAVKRGWSFREPVDVGRIGRFWQVHTNRGMKGANTRFTIDATAGVVVSRGHLAR